MSVPELYGKNCLGDVATVYNPEKDFGFFSLQIFPEASIHLPGERELICGDLQRAHDHLGGTRTAPALVLPLEVEGQLDPQ